MAILRVEISVAVCAAVRPWGMAGFPVDAQRRSTPELLLRGAATITPWVSPGQSGILPQIGLLALLLVGLAAALVAFD
jgi:hypothetical protein